jgi:hypothetical protein
MCKTCGLWNAAQRFSCVIVEQMSRMFGRTKRNIYANIFIYITNSVASLCKRIIPTERPPLVGEVSANFLRIEGATWSTWRIPRPYSRFSRQEPLFFYQVAPQLCARGWVEPGPLDLAKKLWPLDDGGGHLFLFKYIYTGCKWKMRTNLGSSPHTQIRRVEGTNLLLSFYTTHQTIFNSSIAACLFVHVVTFFFYRAVVQHP